MREGAEWYDNKRAGLGDAFQDEFWKAMEAVVARPRSFANTALRVRASRLARFPYVIFFSDDHDEIIVYSVMYGGRDPSTWTHRV